MTNSNIIDTGLSVQFYTEDGVLKSRFVFSANEFSMQPLHVKTRNVDMNLRADLQKIIDEQKVRIDRLEEKLDSAIQASAHAHVGILSMFRGKESKSREMRNNGNER